MFARLCLFDHLLCLDCVSLTIENSPLLVDQHYLTSFLSSSPDKVSATKNDSDRNSHQPASSSTGPQSVKVLQYEAKSIRDQVCARLMSGLGDSCLSN